MKVGRKECDLSKTRMPWSKKPRSLLTMVFWGIDPSEMMYVRSSTVISVQCIGARARDLPGCTFSVLTIRSSNWKLNFELARNSRQFCLNNLNNTSLSLMFRHPIIRPSLSSFFFCVCLFNRHTHTQVEHHVQSLDHGQRYVLLQ